MLIPNLRNDINSGFSAVRLSIDVIEFIRYYSSVLDTWDFSLLSIPEGRCEVASLSVDQYSMDVFEQHNQLYTRLVVEKEKLDPLVELITHREHLLQVKDELERLKKDPSRYLDRRNSHK